MADYAPPAEGVATSPGRSQTLYRFWDANDRLLYVGISVRPWDRWKQHRGEKPWWEEVSRVTLENFATRKEVSAAELDAIRSESPMYNIAGRASGTEDRWADVNSYWNGTHEPNPACIGSLLTCSCKEPDWTDERATSQFPCGVSYQEHWARTTVGNGTGATLECAECDRIYTEWISEQPFYLPEDYANHVIEAVLGERFMVEAQSEQPRARRKPSVKFISDIWPTSISDDLPRRWKHYAREWLDSGLSRQEIREAVEIALDAWSAGRTDRPWAYLSGIARRMVTEKESAPADGGVA